MTDRTKSHLALVGPHSEILIEALKAKDTFDVQQYDAIPYDPSPASVVLSGDGPTPPSALEIDRLLQSKTVIALFKPSRALLETVHKATNTPIHIPSLALIDDLPLLIYSVNGVVHVSPNHAPSEAKVQEFVTKAVDKKADGNLPPMKPVEVSLVNPASPAERSVSAISRALVNVQSEGNFVSNLDPPSDVIGFKKGTIDNTTSIAITWLAWRHDGQYGVHTSDTSVIQLYDLNWYTDLYSYATNVDPRGQNSSDFTDAGGVVYTVAIDRGNIRRSPDSPPRYLGPTPGYCGYYFVDWNQTGNRSDSSMNMTGYQPRGLESQNGTTNNYSINFEQDMQMFNNNGNATYTFKAQYTNQFGLDRFQQHSLQNSSGVDYSVDYKDYYDHWADPDFDTDKWWNPGVYEKDGYWIVREYLPADNVPINALTVFSSSIGQPLWYSKFRTAFRAFKSNAWRTSSDDDTTHFEETSITYGNSDGWCYFLDLTWSAD